MFQKIYSIPLSAEPLRSDTSGDFSGMLVRIGLFLLFLLGFVFACGFAWRTLPGLLAILPLPKPHNKEDDQISLAEPVDYDLLTFSDDPEVLQPNPDPLAKALAGNKVGAVIQAAAEPDAQPKSPIILLRRIEKE